MIDLPYEIPSRDDHWKSDHAAPKRILALDGGGLRGILTLGYLARLEALLKSRHGGWEAFRLSHYFDLIAGTSTGAIIAAGLAKDMTVSEVTQHYMALGTKLFQKSLLRQGFIRAKYDAAKVSQALKQIFGPNVTMGDPSISTGLLVVTKRLDTGSPWPISNNPSGRYFSRSKGGIIPNKNYPLWRVVRASTAAPTYFDPESLVIAQHTGRRTVKGKFVDGGTSPFNNPALQALMYSTMTGYGVNWPVGPEELLVVSVGTGSADPSRDGSKVTALEGVQSFLSLMDDCANLMEILLQWVSNSPTAREFDREMGSLNKDLLSGSELLQYLRYNVTFDENSLNTWLGLQISPAKLKSLSAMDAPENMKLLHAIGQAAAKKQMKPSHFTKAFDLA